MVICLPDKSARPMDSAFRIWGNEASANSSLWEEGFGDYRLKRIWMHLAEIRYWFRLGRTLRSNEKVVGSAVRVGEP